MKVVPATEVFDSIVVTAQRLESSRIVCGLSNKLNPDEQAKFTGDAWERLSNRPQERIRFRVIGSEDEIRDYANHLYVQHGSLNGHDCDDWLEAEKELRTKK